MKPVKLSMMAFGPYADEEILDFRELGHKSIFLIHGPTGSGKTTILDAICFALYGDSSGAERSGKNMRSHHADIRKLTEVVFDFELRGENYRISRIPEQQRLKKSGEGTTPQNPEATLWKLGPNEETCLMQSGWKNVNDEIEKLIGFKSSQFRQVIMLPQGEFRKLLTADSLERQNILEKLFKTEVYRKIEEMLKKSAKELDDEIKLLRNEKAWSLNRVDCKTSDELKALMVQREERLKELEKDVEKSLQDFKKAQESFNLGKEGSEKLAQQEVAYNELEKLKGQRAFFEQKKEELIKARKALVLKEIEDKARLRKEDEEKAKKALEEKNAVLDKSIKEYELSKKKLEAEKGREQERENAYRKVLELSKYKDQVTHLDKARKALLNLEKDLKQGEEEVQNLNKLLIALQESIEKQEAALQEANTYYLKLPLYKAKLEENQKNYHRRIKLETLKKEVDKAETAYHKSLKEYEQIDKEYTTNKKEFFALQEVWNKGHAALLAQGLKDDMPCPVCGSLEHPRIAQREEWIPTEDEINNKQRHIEKLELQKDRLKDQLSERKTTKEKLQGEIKAIEEELGDIKAIDVNHLQESVEVDRKNLELAQKEAESLEAIKQQIDHLKKKHNEEKEHLERKQQQVGEKSKSYESTKGEIIAREANIPEDIRSLEDLSKAEAQARLKWETLKNQLEEAQKSYDDSNGRLLTAKTSQQEAEKHLSEAIEKLSLERENFLNRLQEIGFKSWKDYESSKRDERIIGLLEKELQNYEGSLHSAEDRYKRAQEAAKDIVKVDVEALKAFLIEAEKYKDEVLGQKNTLIEKIKNEKTLLQEILKLEENIQEKEKSYEVVGFLSETSNGINPHGLTFQRFVLATLLDDISIAATERLKRMSKGRYHLQRTLDRSRKNAAGGLELEVLDTYTGIERPVATLSGGETFLASLSLALGLADVVQSYSGGISMDTIFVDEGFGTLDTEALDLAMQALMDLQAGGRLVGIISHVPELKERIDARLEITMSEIGSKATFKVL